MSEKDATIAGNGAAAAASQSGVFVIAVSGKAPTAASRLAAAAGIACAAIAASCTASSDEVRPPSDDFYFPSGMALSPDGRYLGVVNANSDLRYDSGTLLLVDADEIRSLVSDWLATGEVPDGRDCEVDRSVGYTLHCGTEQLIGAGGSVRIGNFATEVAFQELTAGAARAFVAVRGDPSVTWVDLDPAGGRLYCGDGGDHHRCDDEHRLRRVRGDSDLDPLPPEPFGLFVDGGNEYALVTHLTTASVSLIDAPADGGDPVVADVVRGLFQPNSQGLQGAVGIAGRRPGDPSDKVYVTSRSEPSLRSLSVVRGTSFPELAVGRRMDLRDLGRPADNARGLAFNGDGSRAYVVNRSPPALQIVDTSIDALGQPANQPIGSVGLCRQGSSATVADTGRGERVYVACFRDSQVWVINPANQALDTIIPVGRGPHGLVVSEADSLLFVTNFLDDSLSVVDLEQGSETENRVVLRLGWGGRRGTP
jgi:YVTN family beta-propeller protein